MTNTTNPNASPATLRRRLARQPRPSQFASVRDYNEACRAYASLPESRKASMATERREQRARKAADEAARR